VNAYASTPRARKVISNVRSRRSKIAAYVIPTARKRKSRDSARDGSKANPEGEQRGREAAARQASLVEVLG